MITKKDYQELINESLEEIQLLSGDDYKQAMEKFKKELADIMMYTRKVLNQNVDLDWMEDIVLIDNAIWEAFDGLNIK